MNIQKVRRCTCWTSPTFALIYSLILSISPLVLPFVSIISSLILVSSSYSDYKWRELKGISREFFSREIQNSVVPIILISRRLLFLPFVLFFLSFFFNDDSATTRWRRDAGVVDVAGCIVNEARNNVTTAHRFARALHPSSTDSKSFSFFCLARFLSSHWIDV